MPALKSKEVISILQKVGYYIDHTTGSHHIMRHPDRHHRIPVPHHAKDIKRGVLHSIIKQSGLSKQEFLSLR
ncbi:MAG TPA: type II toxin-antitoxin system HicA family toxin [Dehalococcoidia bacterium]|nr:type II toxin-antitoxin system HicA family toxin [Dehalococcoidia bacterium]